MQTVLPVKPMILVLKLVRTKIVVLITMQDTGTLPATIPSVKYKYVIYRAGGPYENKKLCPRS